MTDRFPDPADDDLPEGSDPADAVDTPVSPTGDDGDNDGDGDGDGGPGTRTVSSMPRNALVALVALAVLAVGAIGFALQQRSTVSDLQADADSQSEIASVTGKFATALLTYDYRDLSASSDQIRDLSTPDFAAEYTEAFEAGLGAEILELEATATGTVKDVLVSQSSADTARAIIVADSEIVSAAGQRAAIGTYLDVQLLRIDGQWRVDDVTTVANTDQNGVPAPETSPPPTSTPAPAPETAPGSVPETAPEAPAATTTPTSAPG